MPLRPMSVWSSGSGSSEPLISSVTSLRVLSWGAGAYGVTGQCSQIVHDQYDPTPIKPLPNDVVGVGAGHFHSLAWTAGGELYTWGRNKEWQLGRPLAEDEVDFSATPTLVSSPPLNRHAVNSATGSGVATFAITEDGLLFVVGSSKRGQLGLGRNRARARDFSRVQVPGKVVSVSCGWGHAAAVAEVDKGRRLYTWGWPAHGRLGHSFASSALDEDEEGLHDRCIWEPQEVTLLREENIATVVCGLDSTYCLTEGGSVLSFGDNSLFQLGRPCRPEGEATVPKSLESLYINTLDANGNPEKIKLRRLSAGSAHCVGISSVDGDVLSWGWNAGGQLGLGESLTGDSMHPRPIFGVPNNPEAYVAAGRVHSVLITDDDVQVAMALGQARTSLSACYAWGSGANGRLGTGMCEDLRFPELVTGLEGEVLLGIAAGLDHTLVLAVKDERTG